MSPPPAEPQTAAGDDAMPITDLVPVISQVKALAQLLSGETAAAQRTFANYNKYGLGASQVRAVGHLLTGETGKAAKEQERFANAFLDALDGVPLVGHVKALVHSVTGDAKRATQSMLMATSTLGALVGGMLAGPDGAKAGQTVMDGVISLANATMNANKLNANLRDLQARLGAKP